MPPITGEPSGSPVFLLVESDAGRVRPFRRFQSRAIFSQFARVGRVVGRFDSPVGAKWQSPGAADKKRSLTGHGSQSAWEAGGGSQSRAGMKREHRINRMPQQCTSILEERCTHVGKSRYYRNDA